MLRRRSLADMEPVFAAALVVAGAVLAFLLLANQMGYYRDDWHVAWAGYNRGYQLIATEHRIDRPFMGLLYAQAYRVVGDSPVAWYLFAWLAKMVGAIGFLWLLRMLWPNRRLETTLMALLFVVYPGFLQLPTGSSYSNHLVGLGAGIFSLAFTVRAFQSCRRQERLVFIPLAMFTALVCFGIMEYMVGLEGVRLALLVYLVFREKRQPLLPMLVNLFKVWLPTLFTLGLFLFWRVFIFKSARAATDVGSLKDLYLQNPLAMLSRLTVETVKDIYESIVLAWAVPFYNLTSRASYTSWLNSIALAVVGVLLLLLYMRHFNRPEEDRSIEKKWALPAIWIGLFSAFVTLFPVVLSNRDAQFGDTFDRYTLPASLGVVMVVVPGLLLLLGRGPRRVAYAALLAVAIMTHYHNSVYASNAWEIQRQLWWQISWRVPQFQENTLLVAYLPAPYRLAEDYEIWGPANILYHPRRGEIGINAEILNNDTLVKIQQGIQDNRPFRTMDLYRDFQHTTLVTVPRLAGCLHIIDARQVELPVNVDPLVKLAAPYSRIDQIITEGDGPKPQTIIFGEEPEHGWCYYYQKASLARQQGDWPQVTRLMTEADQQGLSPVDASEWLPFYEAYFTLGQQEQAARLADAVRADAYTWSQFCAQFESAGSGSPAVTALCQAP